MNIRLLIIILLLVIFPCNHVYGKILPLDSTSQNIEKKSIFKKLYEYFEKSNEVNNNKRLDISFIGGPHYSNDTKFGIGLIASGLYRIDKEDLSLSPSNISLYSDFTTSGSYAIGISGNTIFPQDKYRLDLDISFSSVPSKYWGIGYEKGRNEDDYSKYTKKQMALKLDFLKRIAQYTYIGIIGIGQHIRGSNFKDRSYLENRKLNSTAIGGGILVSYDSRDFIPNPYRGLYLKLEQNFFPVFLGSSSNFNRTDFIARFYKGIWKNGILAFDFNATFNNGNVPWNMLSLIGSSYQMRGYYNGQYRDKKLIQMQVELRQKVYNRSGVVIWAGAGNAFPNFGGFEWSHTLPSVGMGYRWEFKNRVNVRIDYGIGKNQNGFYFNINEAF